MARLIWFLALAVPVSLIAADSGAVGSSPRGRAVATRLPRVAARFSITLPRRPPVRPLFDPPRAAPATTVKKQKIFKKVVRRVVRRINKVTFATRLSDAQRSLVVPGFHPAVYVAPDRKREWPRPVIVVLHGTNGRPEWGCDVWKRAGGFYGWILCPRGFPMEEHPGRWTFHDYTALYNEVNGALGALERRYPGKVSRENTVLAGFSLGAVLIPRFAEHHPGMFPYLFLTEGGDVLLDYPRSRTLVRQGLKGIALAIGKPFKRAQVYNKVQLFRNHGVRAAFLYMPGAGHSYGDDFHHVGKAALKEILGYDDAHRKDKNSRPRGSGKMGPSSGELPVPVPEPGHHGAGVMVPPTTPYPSQATAPHGEKERGVGL